MGVALLHAALRAALRAAASLADQRSGDRHRIDRLNGAELTRFGYQPFRLDRQIVSLHFYHNLAFVHKGENDEPSNMFNFDGTPKPERA